MRRAAAVDANQAEIVEALRKCGCVVRVMSQYGRGVPDLMVGHKRVIHLLEVKDGGKPPSERRLNDKQRAFFAEWGEYPVYKVESIKEALAAVGVEITLTRYER